MRNERQRDHTAFRFAMKLMEHDEASPNPSFPFTRVHCSKTYLVQPAANRAPSNKRNPPTTAVGTDTPFVVASVFEARADRKPPSIAHRTYTTCKHREIRQRPTHRCNQLFSSFGALDTWARCSSRSRVAGWGLSP